MSKKFPRLRMNIINIDKKVKLLSIFFWIIINIIKKDNDCGQKIYKKYNINKVKAWI